MAPMELYALTRHSSLRASALALYKRRIKREAKLATTRHAENLLNRRAVESIRHG
jgi:hypothetical protein